MRNIILSRSVAGVFVIAVAAMSLNEAAARFRPIVGVSRSTLKSRCAADGGEFGTGHGGEYRQSGRLQREGRVHRRLAHRRSGPRSDHRRRHRRSGDRRHEAACAQESRSSAARSPALTQWSGEVAMGSQEVTFDARNLFLGC
jgi:hypothetical protein